MVATCQYFISSAYMPSPHNTTLHILNRIHSAIHAADCQVASSFVVNLQVWDAVALATLQAPDDELALGLRKGVLRDERELRVWSWFLRLGRNSTAPNRDEHFPRPRPQELLPHLWIVHHLHKRLIEPSETKIQRKFKDDSCGVGTQSLRRVDTMPDDSVWR